jgi:hypothetical protein
LILFLILFVANSCKYWSDFAKPLTPSTVTTVSLLPRLW